MPPGVQSLPLLEHPEGPDNKVRERYPYFLIPPKTFYGSCLIDRKGRLTGVKLLNLTSYGSCLLGTRGRLTLRTLTAWRPSMGVGSRVQSSMQSSR